MRFLDVLRGANALGIAAVVTLTPAVASADHENDRPERAVVLSGVVSGDVHAVPPTLRVGKQAYLRFEYPGDNSKVMIQVDITPGDPGAAGNAGFHVYGPTNGKLYATGGQTGQHPSHEVEFASTEPGTYLVEIFNAKSSQSTTRDARSGCRPSRSQRPRLPPSLPRSSPRRPRRPFRSARTPASIAPPSWARRSPRC